MISVKEAKVVWIFINKIATFFRVHEIPHRDNRIGFASDGTNTMAGSRPSVMTLFSSLTCSKLLRGVEDCVRDICNYVARSLKRLATLKEFHIFTQTKIHKILHPGQTQV